VQLRRRETGSIAKIFSGSASVFASSIASSLLYTVPVCISPKPVGRNMT